MWCFALMSVTSFVALLWTFSTSFWSPFDSGTQTWFPNSRWSLMRVLYRRKQQCLIQASKLSTYNSEQLVRLCSRCCRLAVESQSHIHKNTHGPLSSSVIARVGIGRYLLYQTLRLLYPIQDFSVQYAAPNTSSHER